ncbi:MAG TPA: hypothetical protein VLH18_02570 [Candidatus Limnocylindrales bacterium]|nr:hypothetical protein [Candidatus Limnocylindrales bacterium]
MTAILRRNLGRILALLWDFAAIDRIHAVLIGNLCGGQFLIFDRDMRCFPGSAGEKVLQTAYFSDPQNGNRDRFDGFADHLSG